MKEREFMRKRGFTLMEIMIVIAILGILAIMIMGNFKASQQKARDIERKSDLTQIGKALELYNQDFGKYPPADATTHQIYGCGSETMPVVCSWGNEFFNTTSGSHVTYMAKLPEDPVSSHHYVYMTDVNGTYYKLYARLENTEDKNMIVPNESTVCGTDGATDVPCNFGVSSTNVVPGTEATPTPTP